MLTDYKSPGVYIQEIPTLAPSIAPVATAIPAFIGYTEKGSALAPTRIDTLLEYQNLFGGPNPSNFSSDASGNITKTGNDNYLMYYGLSLYFQNGGGSCYLFL